MYNLSILHNSWNTTNLLNSRFWGAQYMSLTLFLMQHIEGLQQFMLGTLHHTQSCLALVLKCSEERRQRRRAINSQNIKMKITDKGQAKSISTKKA